MQPRSAVILSLGMLHDKVDTSVFIEKLSNKAKEVNSEFKFTPALQLAAFGLSEKFNQGKMEPEVFKQDLTNLIGIKMDNVEFWKEWNAMISIGDAVSQLKHLKDCAKQNNALIYLNTDTNVVHLEKIAHTYQEMKIDFDTDKNPILLNEVPLYISCKLGKNRNELIKDICKTIKEKEFKVEKTTLILGNPENIIDKSQQMMAKNELVNISKWCAENNISICLHNKTNTLEETFNQLFQPSEKNEPVSRPSALIS